jgi:hypothetical protein
MRLCRGDAAYMAATALLAVHSSIAYNDAVYVKLTGKRHHNEDHQAAISNTRKVCDRLRLPVAGLSHLKRLIGYKTYISYGDQRVEDDLVEVLCLSAERFEAWAVNILRM